MPESITEILKAMSAIEASLRELVARRTEACLRHGGNPDGSDGRYSRAREALASADKCIKNAGLWL